MNQADVANNKVLKILLVEDNEDDVELTCLAFKKSELASDVFVASDGQEGLDFLYHRGKFEDKEKYPRPDVVLLDINMPKITGFDFLSMVKDNEFYKTIPIVMLTSSVSEDDIKRCYLNGASSYIQKLVDFEEFEAVIQRFNSYWIEVNQFLNV